MRGSRLLFFASWVFLLIVSAAAAFLSLVSLWRAYSGATEALTAGVTSNQIREYGKQIREHAGDEAVAALKGRRATAATWALGYALLAIAVVMVPYRRGERWAWWALLVAIGFPQMLSLARVVTLGTSSGLSAAATILALTLVGLLAGAPRMFARPDLGAGEAELERD